jgi:hypothetical protein
LRLRKLRRRRQRQKRSGEPDVDAVFQQEASITLASCCVMQGFPQ